MAELRVFFVFVENLVLGPFLKSSINFSTMFSYYAFAERENKERPMLSLGLL